MKSKLGKINRIFRINFFLSLLFFAVFLAADLVDNPIDRILSSDYDVNTIKIIRKKSYLNSDIIFIHDDQLNVFLVKKNKRNDPKYIIKEVVGSWVADKVDIPANLVRALPVKGALADKLHLNGPATIHSLVPGKPVSRTSHPSGLNLRQTVKNGLKYNVIHGMSFHKDLPPIVALDTFIGNHDRNKRNFFYDDKSDSFFAIDFGGTFKANFARLASIFIAQLKKKHIKLSRKEVYGLILYRNTIKKLVETVTPNTAIKKISDTALNVSGISQLDLLNFEKSALDNYADSKRLLKLLNELLQSYPNIEKNKYIQNHKSEWLAKSDVSCDWCQNMRNEDLLKEYSSQQREYIIERMCAYRSVFCEEI